MVNAIQQFTTSPTTLTSPFTPVLEFNVPVTGIVIFKFNVCFKVNLIWF